MSAGVRNYFPSVLPCIGMYHSIPQSGKLIFNLLVMLALVLILALTPVWSMLLNNPWTWPVVLLAILFVQVVVEHPDVPKGQRFSKMLSLVGDWGLIVFLVSAIAILKCYSGDNSGSSFKSNFFFCIFYSDIHARI